MSIEIKKLAENLLLCCIPLIVVGCGSQERTEEADASHEAEDSEPAASAAASISNPVAAGKVVETMDAAGYTYVQVDTGSKKVWAAAPKCEVKVGDELVVPMGMAMRDYHSKTLDRDFDVVYFVNSLHSADGAPLTTPGAAHGATASEHSRASGGSAPEDIDVSGVEKAEGGKTIEEIYSNKSELSGEEVTVRGKVTKFNSQIMGKNWLHIGDGSGDADEGTHDLTVTTDATAEVGDTVLVKGNLELDKDFGFGYKYDLIIENAQVEVE